jgi:hypothetical protein
MTARGVLSAFSALVAGVFSLGFFVWSGYIGGFGWLMADRRCYDACHDRRDWFSSGLDWTYFPDSWQWTALGLLGTVVFCAGLVFLIAVAKGKTTLAWSLFVIHLAALAAFLFIRSSGGVWDGEPGGAEVLAAEVGGILAIRLREAGVAIWPSGIGRVKRHEADPPPIV